MRILILAAALILSSAVSAQSHSADECREGGDFIRNAALSRDGGMTRESFVGRLEGGMQTIRAFPPALRWFVHDADDERFLRIEVEVVFDKPETSERHRAAFMARCTERSARLTTPSS